MMQKRAKMILQKKEKEVDRRATLTLEFNIQNYEEVKMMIYMSSLCIESSLIELITCRMR